MRRSVQQPLHRVCAASHLVSWVFHLSLDLEPLFVANLFALLPLMPISYLNSSYVDLTSNDQPRQTVIRHISYRT